MQRIVTQSRVLASRAQKLWDVRTASHSVGLQGARSTLATPFLPLSTAMRPFSAVACSKKHELFMNSLQSSSKPPCRFAGHSKWANIKHTKMSKDDQKSREMVILIKNLKKAVKDGGPKPEFNPALRRLMEQAQARSIPKATLLKQLAKVEKSAADLKPLFVECRGPFNSMLIVELATSRPKHCRHNVAGIVKKFGGKADAAGAKLHFENKGIVEAEAAEGAAPITPEQAEDIAIEVGAENVSSSKDEMDEEKTVYQYICDVGDLGTVRKNLEDHGLLVTSAYLGYIPIAFADVEEKDAEIIAELMNRLEDFEDTVRIYDNFKFAS